ncbi:MAG: integration host factor [Gammaproteobacteria bacterium]|jgi:DNA-binding protein HU-beta|nr:integration host factor [Gammaproteobacteria bacterium]|tara:strand:+ start:7340 stop:7615 length:276 start_codon:yes stop_codon:yes gene_type:complete
MTKGELVEVVQSSSDGDLSKKAMESIVNCTFQTIAKDIKKSKRFSYPGFGTFTVRKRKARIGRNPQTGAKLKIKASKTVGFKPSPSLKSSL